MTSTLRTTNSGIFVILAAILVAGCSADAANTDTAESHSPPVAPTPLPTAGPGALTAAFLAVDGVYNSELMAPYDILHHSVFRDSVHHIVPFVVSPDGGSVTTFEGLEVGAHYSFATSPEIDILVIPSAQGSMSSDLENTEMIEWIRTHAATAKYVITLCDGAFPLAATGLLDGLDVTTFPSDRDALKEMFPELNVHYDANFVVDGKYITSVGGALSYEPALYLLEREYSRENAEETALGLVLDWELAKIPHIISSD